MTGTTETNKIFLIIASLIGFLLVALSIIIRSSALEQVEWMLQGIIPELLFECGVVLWGAAVTVYLLEIVLEREEILSRQYRKDIIKRIA